MRSSLFFLQEKMEGKGRLSLPFGPKGRLLQGHGAFPLETVLFFQMKKGGGAVKEPSHGGIPDGIHSGHQGCLHQPIAVILCRKACIHKAGQSCLPGLFHGNIAAQKRHGIQVAGPHHLISFQKKNLPAPDGAVSAIAGAVEDEGCRLSRESMLRHNRKTVGVMMLHSPEGNPPVRRKTLSQG